MKGSIFSQIPQHLSTFVLTHYPVFLEYSWQAINIVMVVACFTSIALGARAYKVDNTATKIRDICDNNVYPNRKLCHIKSQWLC
jgi:hypothetical protein